MSSLNYVLLAIFLYIFTLSRDRVFLLLFVGDDDVDYEDCRKVDMNVLLIMMTDNWLISYLYTSS